ncbi:9381_t:CDS:1, partial [Racocetra fulgida]
YAAPMQSDNNPLEDATLSANLNSPMNQTHVEQLLQSMINVMARQQGSQPDTGERNLLNIPVFTGDNQDPIGWLEMVDRVFEANKIVGIQRLS